MVKAMVIPPLLCAPAHCVRRGNPAYHRRRYPAYQPPERRIAQAIRSLEIGILRDSVELSLYLLLRARHPAAAKISSKLVLDIASQKT